jgi:hypothetical protein
MLLRGTAVGGRYNRRGVLALPASTPPAARVRPRGQVKASPPRAEAIHGDVHTSPSTHAHEPVTAAPGRGAGRGAPRGGGAGRARGAS